MLPVELKVLLTILCVAVISMSFWAGHDRAWGIASSIAYGACVLTLIDVFWRFG